MEWRRGSVGSSGDNLSPTWRNHAMLVSPGLWKIQSLKSFVFIIELFLSTPQLPMMAFLLEQQGCFKAHF